jgi:hypothetical protein
VLIGALLIGAFWALVLALSLTGRRLPLSVAALGLTVLLLAALALQPRVHAAGWVALVATFLVVAVLYAVGGFGGLSDDD